MLLLIVMLLLISLTSSSQKVCNDNDIFDKIYITYPNNNDTVIGITTIETTYEVKDLQVYNNHESQVMLCLTIKKHNSNDMKSVCGLSLLRSHVVSLYYDGYQDIILSICVKGDNSNCICSTSVTVYNDYKPSCIINTKLNTMHDIIRVVTMADKEDYFYSYPIIIESQTNFEIFVPVHNIDLKNSETLPILSLADSIEDILTLKVTIRVTVHFLLDINYDNNKDEVHSFSEWVQGLMNNVLVTSNIYLCQPHANCIFWTIYEKLNLIDSESIILVIDSNLKMQKSYMQSIYNLFLNTNPCYVLPLWRKNTPTSLFYIDTEVKHELYRWAFANISQCLNNNTTNIDASIAFRLKTFSYFLKEQKLATSSTIFDHLMNAYKSNNRISIVHN